MLQPYKAVYSALGRSFFASRLACSDIALARSEQTKTGPFPIINPSRTDVVAMDGINNLEGADMDSAIGRASVIDLMEEQPERSFGLLQEFDRAPPQEIKFLYLLEHPGFPGWVKFGETTNLPKRLGVYQTASPHEVQFFQTWDIPAMVRDKDFFVDLRAVSSSDESEWFEVPAELAAKVISARVDELWKALESRPVQDVVLERVPNGGDFHREGRFYDLSDLEMLDESDWELADSQDELTEDLADAVLQRFMAA